MVNSCIVQTHFASLLPCLGGLGDENVSASVSEHEMLPFLDTKEDSERPINNRIL